VAHALGADIIIGIDVGSPLKPADKLISVLEIIYQLGMSGAVCSQPHRELCDVLVTPDVNEFTFADFDQAAEIIARGERAARKTLQECAEKIDFLSPVASPNRQCRKMPARQDTLSIASLHLEGVSAEQREFVIAALNLNIPDKVTIEELENAVDRVYSTQLFERMTYQLKEAGNGMALNLIATGKPANAFRFGIRYESDLGTSLLFSKIRRNVTGPGSRLLFELRVGQPVKVDAKYFAPLGSDPDLGFELRANYTGARMEMYENGRRSASYRARSYALEVFLGTILSRSMAWGIGLKNELVHLDPDIALKVSVAERRVYAAPFGLLHVDAIDRTVFPRQGLSILLKSECVYKVGQDLKFSKRYWRHFFDGRAYLPIWERLSLSSHALLGLTSSSGTFLSHRFFLGGVDSFAGLNPHELSGAQLLALQLGLQYEVMRGKFVILRGNIGKTSDSRQGLVQRKDHVTGAAVTVGAATRFGPVEFTAMHSDRHWLQLHLNLGYKF
jgi:NTE family protein